MISPSIIKRYIQVISPKAHPGIRDALSRGAGTLLAYGINNSARLKAFLAQMAHESANFRALIELRPDSSAESKYGHHTRVGKILGNTLPGDGARFKGRGIIQLTGRYNYGKYGKMVGQDLVNDPALAAEPDIAVEVACAYWKSKGLNPLADQGLGKYREITRRINGGYNGYADRLRKYRKLLRED
jgi:predicted chitinase